nr:MAG TPA: hypothetical protein [Caudoviricetes sp.]
MAFQRLSLSALSQGITSLQASIFVSTSCASPELLSCGSGLYYQKSLNCVLTLILFCGIL